MSNTEQWWQILNIRGTRIFHSVESAKNKMLKVDPNLQRNMPVHQWKNAHSVLQVIWEGGKHCLNYSL